MCIRDSIRVGALNAGVEVCFVYGVILALVDVVAFALWTNVLDGLRMFQEYLDVTPGQAVMVIEEVIYAMPFLECVRGAFPRFLHSLYVASIVVVVHITQSLTTMQPVISVSYALREHLSFSRGVRNRDV